MCVNLLLFFVLWKKFQNWNLSFLCKSSSRNEIYKAQFEVSLSLSGFYWVLVTYVPRQGSVVFFGRLGMRWVLWKRKRSQMFYTLTKISKNFSSLSDSAF